MKSNKHIVKNSIETALKELSSEIKPAVEALDILTMISAHESMGFVYDRQVKGPALSYFQIEPDTHFDIYSNYLKYRSVLRGVMLSSIPKGRLVQCEGFSMPDHECLVDYPVYAAKVARIILYRVPEKLPVKPNSGLDEYLSDLSKYAKKHYNTPLGKATSKKYLDDFVRYAL